MLKKHRKTFNRTTMELKQSRARRADAGGRTFNRTTMELKP